ncbi:MAG TPA: ClpXP protease specificity-enhancing factor SspB [Beijerinckiaceae bacterium]|nr:ClpXP protease specificity-enhancing factor SspB [Beijerinckiaceae bacterium]
MSTDLIRYDLMVQDALLGVVRKILADTARDGLLGDHHFYVTFRTGLPGVRLSARMREAYPEEMTIVLQHQFWDLEVNEHGFQVGLSFKGTAELLVIPFDAITGFFDPSVQFGLKFEIQDMRPEAGANDAMPPKLAMQKNAGKSSAKTAEAARNAPRGAGAEPVIVPPREAASSASSEKAASTPKSSDKKSDGTSDAKSAEAKIVSIDAFRKKP